MCQPPTISTNRERGKNTVLRKASFFCISPFALGLVLWCQSGSVAHATSPSFNCAKASAPDERAICGDDALAELDRQTTAAWRHLRGTDYDRATRIARELLEARHACGSNKVCIKKSQEQALVSFRPADFSSVQTAVGQPSKALPAQSQSLKIMLLRFFVLLSNQKVIVRHLAWTEWLIAIKGSPPLQRHLEFAVAAARIMMHPSKGFGIFPIQNTI